MSCAFHCCVLATLGNDGTSLQLLFVVDICYLVVNVFVVVTQKFQAVFLLFGPVCAPSCVPPVVWADQERLRVEQRPHDEPSLTSGKWNTTLKKYLWLQ